ncbi:MAG: hypothetical protein JWM02_1315 [Frankiales bacterium]|nr:hypothetical protein [Frankiales bacterium]
MTDTGSAVTLVGMPETGKSTYLAALYHLLSEQLTGTATRLIRQPEQRSYLEQLRMAWLAGEQVGRTSQDNGELIELDVAFDSRQVQLSLPDIAGESFRDIIVHRHADARIVDLVRSAAGLILFTHPDHQRPRVLISQARKLAEVLGEQFEGAVEKDFDPLRVPGEVHLVDLLEWVVRTRAVEAPCRLAVMVSAWDRCPDITPSDWLAAKMPMLRQYLDGHDELFNFRVYGVCAQGGAYGGSQDLAAKRPYDRAYIVDSDGVRSGDLSEPVRWAALG